MQLPTQSILMGACGLGLPRLDAICERNRFSGG